MALNTRAVELSSKSESLNSNDANIMAFHPDYYQQKWEWIGTLKNKIYKAEIRLEKKNA